MPEKPEKPGVPEEPQWSRPPIEEGPKQRPTGAESTPGGVGAPLGTETYETQALPALDALLQTNFMEDLKVKGLKDLQPHVESHEPFGDDRMLAFGPLYIHDVQYAEYTKAGMADADGNTVLFTLGAYNSTLSFGLSLARNVTDRAGAFLDHFNANVWDPVFMNISRVHTGTPGVQPDMDEGSVSRLAMREHDIIEVRRLEFQDTDQSAGNDISVQQRGDAAGAILEIVSNNDATQYSSPIYRRLRLADPVGADDAATKRYVDALSYAGHALLDGSLHTDTLAAGVTDGSIVIGNVTPKWSELVISIPAANVRNVLGVDNAELRPSWKAALDATNPADIANAAGAGTSLVFAHRDHVHAHPAGLTANLHHAKYTNAEALAAAKAGAGIADDNLVQMDDVGGLTATGEYAKFATDGLVGRTVAELLGDINVAAGADVTGANAPQAHAASHVNGTDDVQDATAGQKGVATAAQITKLDAIEALADVTDAANVATAGAVMDSDVAPGEGFLRKTGAGAYTAHKSNLAAAAAPGVNNDAAAGYSVGSVWIDTTNDDMHICVDSTNGAAVWLHLNAAAAAHDHTTADGSGVLTNDEHDGYSEYAEIAAPAAPAANKLRLYAKDVGGVSLPLFQNSEGVETTLVGVGRPLKTTFWDYDDMLSHVAVGHSGHLYINADGTAAAWGNFASVASHPGCWYGVTGSTATGHSRLSAQDDHITFSNGRVRLGAWIRIGAALSVVANRYNLYAGIMDDVGVVTSQNGIMLLYRDDLSANWLGYVYNGGGLSSVDTGVLVAINTWYFLEMEINAAGNSVEFFINDASVGVIASGPAANSTAEVRTGILKSTGTSSKSAIWDAFYLEGELTVAR